MEMRDFLLEIRTNDAPDKVIYYRDGKYTATSDPSINDILDDIVFDAEALQDLQILIEIPSKGVCYKKVVQTTEVSPLALPEADTTALPKVKIAFNPENLAPEQLVLQDQFALPVVTWHSLSIQIPDQWPPIDSSFGIPFGSYRLEIGLPELPDLKKKTAEVVVSLDSELNLSVFRIRSGRMSREYSIGSYSIEWIDPTAYKFFLIVKERVKDRQSKKIEDAILRDWDEFLKGGSSTHLDELNLAEEEEVNEPQFQIGRNLSGYRFLYFLENSLRNFLWQKLKTAYKESSENPNWWKGCLPEDVRKHILDKMSTRNPVLDNIKSETSPLSYCTFGELGQIAEKEWQRFFKQKPLDQVAFSGHLAYLEHIRNAIAHNRPLTTEEIRILYQNGKSVMTMLGLEFRRTGYRALFGGFTI